MKNKAGKADTKNPLTNGDKIRNFSDKDLAKRIHEAWTVYVDHGKDLASQWCDGLDKKTGEECVGCDDEKHKACIVWWLNQPAEEA